MYRPFKKVYRGPRQVSWRKLARWRLTKWRFNGRISKIEILSADCMPLDFQRTIKIIADEAEPCPISNQVIAMLGSGSGISELAAVAHSKFAPLVVLPLAETENINDNYQLANNELLRRFANPALGEPWPEELDYGSDKQ